MIPDGWKREPLCNIAKIRTGIAIGKKSLIEPVSIPYLRVANAQDGHLDLSVIKKIEVEPHQIDRYRLQDGDVLMTEGGDFDKLGRGDVWKGQIDPCLHQNHVFCVRPDQRIILPYFLTSLSGSSYGKFYFLSCAKKSTNLASINSTQLKEFPVLIPPIHEQKKIARILSTWDKAIETIETIEKLIENSKAQKKALMQQLLTGKQRLPGCDEKWKVLRINKMGEIVSGGTPSTTVPEYWGGNVLWVTPTDITKLNEHYISNTSRTITIEGVKNSSARILPAGTLLVCTRATVGELAIAKKPISTNQGFKNLIPNQNFDVEFIYYLFSYYKHLFQRIACGSTFLEISKSDFEKQRFLVPSFSEQKTISAIFNSADKEIVLLGKTHTKLINEKKSLMQQLLTGKRRVKVDS